MKHRTIYLFAAAAGGALTLTACGMAPEQAQAIGDLVAERVAESGKFDPEQSQIIGDAVSEALQGSGSWQSLLSTVVNGALGLVLTYLGIRKGAETFRAVKAAKQAQQG